jgi:hypothetical protein
MRLLHRLIGLAELGAALAVVTMGCGDDEPATPQAVFWFGLSPATGRTCSSARNYQFPATASQTIASSSGAGDRIVDGGENRVRCQVTAVAGDPNGFDLDADFASGEIGNFSIRGRMSKTVASDLDIDLSGGFSLEQDGCTATVNNVLGGAVWLSNLSCPNLTDPSSPGIACVANGGLIFENCGR